MQILVPVQKSPTGHSLCVNYLNGIEQDEEGHESSQPGNLTPAKIQTNTVPPDHKFYVTQKQCNYSCPDYVTTHIDIL
jgi:hypothetical protein